MGGVSRHSEGVGAEALLAATGRTPAEWLAILDAHNAMELDHTSIARWIGVTHPEIGSWWAQSVTVMYEQERGMRLPGQVADGTFSVSASTSITGERDEVLSVAVATVAEIVGLNPASVNPDARYPTARWKIDGETLLITVNATTNGKTSVSLTRSRIRDASRVEDAKAAVKAAVAALANRVGTVGGADRD